MSLGPRTADLISTRSVELRVATSRVRLPATAGVNDGHWKPYLRNILIALAKSALKSGRFEGGTIDTKSSSAGPLAFV